jgi:hypothetical protein
MTNIAISAVRQVVRLDEETKVVTDQAPAYGDLGVYADHETADHSVGYRPDNDLRRRYIMDRAQ